MISSRRKLAKTLGIAGAGAAMWQKPMVNAVSLPAHAQTSGCTSVCWELSWSFSGDFTGGAGYQFFDPSCSLIQADGDDVSGTDVESGCFDDLAAGTYYMFMEAGGSGSTGTMTVSAEVSCCASDESVNSSLSTTSSSGINMYAAITIDENGNCSAEVIDNLGSFPCELL